MNKVILDANYILAILDQTDIHHKPAVDIDDKIQAVFDEILYLDCVINEVVSVTIKRLKERKKKELIPDYLKRLHQLIPKTSITWIYPEIEDYYEEVLKTVAQGVREGALFSSLLSSYPKYFPIMVGQMAAVGETTGRVDEMMNRIADFYDDEVNDMMANLSELIQPMLILIIGVLVALLFASILLPIYNLAQSFQV